MNEMRRSSRCLRLLCCCCCTDVALCSPDDDDAVIQQRTRRRARLRKVLNECRAAYSHSHHSAKLMGELIRLFKIDPNMVLTERRIAEWLLLDHALAAKLEVKSRAWQ